MRDDPYDLDRFVMAQAPVYDIAFSELMGGRKVTHWMWFIFPQLRGLGHSSMSRRLGIGTIEEARAYLAHPVLGQRLRECVTAVLDSGETDLGIIFGSPDDRKFCSSMTLFALADQTACGEFHAALEKFAHGVHDERTLEMLAA